VSGILYRSTRDVDGQAPVGFVEALQRGLAPDGGLYIPDNIPTLPPAAWRADSLADAAALVLRPFLPEPVAPWLADIEQALDFPVPLRQVDERTHLLELFHGPTRAFKDVAARVLGRWFARVQRGATVLVATSGDTGSAVAAGMAGIPGLRVVVVFPRDGVSPVQRAQLTTARPGVSAWAVDGSFDDCQQLVKQAFLDPALAHLSLTSANSINLGRWLPQAAFHAWAWLQLRQAGIDPAQALVVVPSGNLGNLVAGILTAAMGARVGRLLAAHNRNDYLVDYFAGRRAAFDFPVTVRTPSNAMDVGAPSNFERMHALWRDRWPCDLQAARVDDSATLARMARVKRELDVLVCPHTAVGWEAADANDWDGPRVILATAHPAKFPDVVARAIPGLTARDPLLDAALDNPGSAVAIGSDFAGFKARLLDL